MAAGRPSEVVETGEAGTAGSPTPIRRDRFYRWLLGLSLAGLGIRLTWIATSVPHVVTGGDGLYYFAQAAAIKSGMGWFVAAQIVSVPGHPAGLHFVQSAQHPPLWVLVLALADFLGLNSFLSHLVVACVISAGAVFVTGLAAREVAGPRVGLLAAFLAAVYPNYWLNDGRGFAETLLLLLVAAIVFVSYRLWHRPTRSRAVGLGALCGLAALTRSEQLLLLALLVVPLTLVMRHQTLRHRLALMAAALAMALVTIAPWVGFNLSRFEQPVFMSTDLGGTLAFSNCRSAYYGSLLGYGNFKCLTRVYKSFPDESMVDAHFRRVALHYMSDHIARLPVVMAARVGRELGFYVPLQQIDLEASLSGRPVGISKIALGAYYVLLVEAVLGAVALRRRKTLLVPFGGLALGVLLSSLLTTGSTRYRIPLEVVIVILSAVAVDVQLKRFTPARWRRPVGTDAKNPPPW